MASEDALQKGYETRDLSAKGLGYVLIGLAVTVAVAVGIVFLLIALLSRWDTERYAGLTREEVATLTPPGPHLLVNPEEALAQLRVRQQHLLESYAWVDPQHTRAHVPIERAMKLVIGHSLDEAP